MASPNTPLFPLGAMTSADGNSVQVAFGYWEGQQPQPRFQVVVAFSDYTDKWVETELSRLQAVANKVDAMNAAWEPKVIAASNVVPFAPRGVH